FGIFSSARSLAVSAPTTVASRDVDSPARLTFTVDAPFTTCALVMISPSLEMMTPVPASSSVPKRPLDTVARMFTTDGPTLATICATSSLLPESASERAADVDCDDEEKTVVAPWPSSACVATAAVPPDSNATATIATDRCHQAGEVLEAAGATEPGAGVAA